ncbi:MAG: hypothetical protein JST01_23860 [Cyanobacteria bacterium SZAS TMP-1]|nr:hypothetical protein [Cyanobacteria bacterium SZAS TMP-1]
MHKRVMQLLLAPLMLAALLLGFASPSFAAQTWRPSFSSGHHVYLDPALQGGNNPVNLDGLEKAYQEESAKNGIEVFFIMTLKGDETTPGKDFARTRLDEIMGNWGGQSGFPADRAIVCYVVRLNTDWTKSAVACNVASELAKKGLDKGVAFNIADHYSQHRTANPDALLPQNPKGFALTIAREFNQTAVDYAAAQIAAQKQAEAERIAAQKRAEAERIAAAERAKTVHTITVAVEIGGPILLLLIVLGVLYGRKRKAFNKAAKEIGEWETLFQTADANYIELESHYLDFLKRQGANWNDKFKGTTLTRYTAAITAYADLSARIQTASKLIASAKKANDSGNIFSVAGNEAAYAMLTSADVTIDSKSLSFEQQGLFGALLDGKANTKKPKELLDDMDNLFRTTNSTMAAIMQAFEGSEQNRKDIDRLFGEVDALKANLTEAKLSFDAYQGDFDAVGKAKAAFLAILDSDPLTAFDKSQKVEADAEALKAKIGHAIELRNSLASTEEVINKADARIKEVRGQSADYAYPDGGSPATGAAVNFLLNEAGNNPDEALSEAREAFSSAVTLVVAGKLDESRKAKAEAESKAGEAVAVVAKVLAAKDLVKKQVPVVHGVLTKLTGEIPAGEEALAALNAGFLPANFDSAPGQIKRANAVKESTSSQLAAVKAAFFEQRYVAAAALVQTVTGDIQGSRDGIIAVQTRLKELTSLRQHAKEQTAANTQTSEGLKSKLAANAFTTSAQTDGRYSALLPTLGRHQAEVAKAVADWPTAASAADKLAGDFKGVDGAIDTEKAAYDHAGKSLATLRQAVANAANEANNNVVRQAAHNQVAQVQQILGQAEAAIKVAKSDWNSLSQRFDANVQTATAAQNAARADKTAYNNAVQAINEAQSFAQQVESGSYVTYSSIGGRYSGNYGAGVSANCSQAYGYLNSANRSLGAQQYEDAERQADQAKNAAAQAKADAEARVQQLIAAAVLLWEAEERERRRREEEEERERQRQRDAEAQRQRDADAQRQRDNDSNTGFGGGSNSDGGGFSGGSNSQGGDFS